MSDPVTWAYIAAAASAATAVVGGVQASNQAETEADIQKANAEAAAQQASAAEDLQRRRNRGVLARQRAAIAESGIGFGGSAERLQQDSAVQAELDALNVRYEGTVRQMGFKTGAQFSKAQASNAMSGAYLAAGGELLGGASDVHALKVKQVGSAGTAPGTGSGYFRKFRVGT
jgi:hypothetical protein